MLIKQRKFANVILSKVYSARWWDAVYLNDVVVF